VATVTKKPVAEVEIARHEWETFRVMGDNARKVPSALVGLLAAVSADEAKQYYWRLEGTVVVSGQLFEAAVYVVPVLLAGLLDDVTDAARGAVLELLYQIVAGESHQDEVARGLADLGEQCRQRAREGLWVLYKQLANPGYAPAAVEVLELLEVDSARLLAYREAFAS
jgi:hypothetical protein